ncbi:MAG: PAS domain-containing sensor histidine kinase [Ignavibacteria bacterium]|nr:PAS domain-containing sensor histidine kinase [Ignavibacteria bacterium]
MKTDSIKIGFNAAAILLTDESGKVIDASKKLLELFDVNSISELEEILNKAKVIDKNNNSIKFEDLPFLQSKEKSKSRTTVLKFIVKNFEKWFLIQSFNSEKNKSEENFNTSFFTDITIESDLVQAYKETFSSISTVLYSTNNDGSEYYFITEAVRNLFGFSPEEVYNNKLLLLRSIDKKHFQKFKDFVEALRNGEPSIVEYRMKDRFGKDHWVRHSGFPIIKNGLVKKVVGMIVEITDEKITRLKLESSEERFRMLIDTADDLIFILNGFGYFNLVNENGAKALGYLPEEMLGKHFLEFIDKDDESKIAEAFSKILSSNDVTTFEADFLDRFDKSVTFEINAKPLITNGQVSGMISIGRNITNRKMDEQKIRDLNSKLVEANRIISIERERARHKITVLEELNKLKSEFVSNISHELRTPLASIVGFAETMISDPELPKETSKEFSEIILSEGRRLAKLINDVLEFSKLESGEEELAINEFSLTAVLSEAAAKFEKQIDDREITLTKEFPKQKILINADRDRILHVFINLISNAVRFNNYGGRISIIVHDYGKEVEVAINDTGIGIAERDLPKLFQKFSKITKQGAPVIGAGFGLAIVKQIVELHKGVVRVKSEESKGSTFIVRLPKLQNSRG